MSILNNSAKLVRVFEVYIFLESQPINVYKAMLTTVAQLPREHEGTERGIEGFVQDVSIPLTLMLYLV